MHSLSADIRLVVDIQPLINSIRKQNAVIFVGAGASKAAGLPDWESFLKQCLYKAKTSLQKSTPDNHNMAFRRAEELLRGGDFLMSAELLQQEIGSTLSTYIWESFGTKRISTEVHRAIAKIPFSIAITTNYDKLLEGAYINTPNVFTWLDPQAIFSSIKNNRFAVIKTHGDVGNNPSLVLTKTHYRNLMYLNKAFNDELTSLLSLKTFLFVGSSLRDNDLLRLMDEGKLTYESNFGPHYAFLFEEEIDESFVRYLREAYNIHVIISNAKDTSKTESLCSFLKVLSGRVSELNDRNSETIAINSDLFHFNKVVHKRLYDILNQTGADRGTIAFIDRRELLRIRYNIERNSLDKNIIDHYPHSTKLYDQSVYSYNSHDIISNFYSKGSNDVKYVYYADITLKDKPDTDLNKWEFDIDKAKLHSETKSLLLTQIVSDGQTVGVVLIDSSTKDAFTVDHLNTLQTNTILLGAAFKELELRNIPLLGVNLRENANLFQKLMDESYLLKGHEISYLLYEIDHREGKLICHYDDKVKKDKINFSYSFKEESLATYVLSKQQEMYYDDVQLGIDANIISKNGVDTFNVNGSIYATPVKVGIYTSFILVAWARKQTPSNILFKNVINPISRLAHLIANSIDSDPNMNISLNNSAQFIETINQQLKPIDRNKPWTRKVLNNEDNRRNIYEILLKSLTDKCCGLARVRLWYYDEQNKIFSCIYSYSLDKEGKDTENNYTDIRTGLDDIYCQYTLNRYSENPYAMHQHKNMFGIPDPNTENLDKDPDGKWIVGPIVNKKSNELLGFISADNHYIINGKPEEKSTLSEKRDAYQRYAVDLISDLLVPVMRYHRIALQSAILD